MKVKALMIFLIVVSYALGIVTAFLYGTSDIASWARLYSTSGITMGLFGLVALYYSYVLGTSKKVILFSALAPVLYSILNSLLFSLIYRNSSDVMLSWVLEISWVIGLGVTLIVYFVNFKYSKSSVFLVLIVFSMLGAMIPFSNIIGGFNSITNSMIFYRTPKAILLVIAILYDKKISVKYFNMDGQSTVKKEILNED